MTRNRTAENRGLPARWVRPLPFPAGTALLALVFARGRSDLYWAVRTVRWFVASFPKC